MNNIWNEIKSKLKTWGLYEKCYVPVKRLYSSTCIKRDVEQYVKKQYQKNMGMELNLENPVLYTEKIQFRKLYEKNPLYTKLADKVEVRKYVYKVLKDELENQSIKFPETYGIYDNPTKIKLEELPDSFVLKSNHASGHVILVQDKHSLDWKRVVNKMEGWLKTNYYYEFAEWQYKDIKPQIICEELLDNDIVDYRIFCFKGQPYITKVTRHNKHSVIHPYFDATYYNEWEKTGIIWNKNYISQEFKRPKNFELMLEMATKLSCEFEFVRVDLYTIEDNIYFSELTFTPNSGFEPDLDIEWNRRLGEKFEVSQYGE